MREFELETWNSCPEEISIIALCWRCNEGWNKGKLLVSPCKCTNQFIHLRCLEISANTEDVIHCQFCCTRYPLEIKQKSLLKCYRDGTLLDMVRDNPFLLNVIIFICWYLIFIMIFIYYLYVIMSFDHVWDHKIIIIIFVFNLYLWSSCFFIYKTIPYVINFTNRIGVLYHQWIKSTQEFKLMEQYPNNIQVISV